MAVFSPNSVNDKASDVVGSGSDGSTYWNLFNIEEESAIGALYVTYNSLNDMLMDTNPVGVFSPNTNFHNARNVVGSGAMLFEVGGPGPGPGPGPNPVPEPGTMLLFGSGLAGLIGWRWQNRKTA